jgi:hypothetical protein
MMEENRKGKDVGRSWELWFAKALATKIKVGG